MFYSTFYQCGTAAFFIQAEDTTLSTITATAQTLFLQKLQRNDLTNNSKCEIRKTMKK